MNKKAHQLQPNYWLELFKLGGGSLGYIRPSGSFCEKYPVVESGYQTRKPINIRIIRC